MDLEQIKSVILSYNYSEKVSFNDFNGSYVAKIIMTNSDLINYYTQLGPLDPEEFAKQFWSDVVSHVKLEMPGDNHTFVSATYIEEIESITFLIQIAIKTLEDEL